MELENKTKAVSASPRTVSMHDVIRQQAELEEEAAEAIPFNFTQCTFGNTSMHEAKQPLYSCLTCRPQPLDPKDRAGICAGCSVSCHGDCELVELFSRRDFVCDCGTSRIPGQKCSLTLRKDDVPVVSNKYDANFDGIFCVCQTRYDPETEWVGCTSLPRAYAYYRSLKNMRNDTVPFHWYHTTKCLAKDIQSNKPDDSILHPDSFDTFVCEKCISGPASDTIARYAGTPGFMVLSASGILTSDLAKAQLVQQKVETEAGAANGKKDEGSPSPPALQIATSTSSSLKRPLPIEGNTPKDEDGDEVPSKAKAQKLEHLNSEQKTMQCQAPPVRNEAFLSASLPRKDVYLEDGWRERLCRCVQCMALYLNKPYLLTEEEVYEPPEDADAGKSLLDLGTAALLQMPREQAVQGLEAYTSMRDGLMKYLEPFAREGKVVQESDIQNFFEAERRKKAGLS